jgi:hypothetical protein
VRDVPVEIEYVPENSSSFFLLCPVSSWLNRQERHQEWRFLLQSQFNTQLEILNGSRQRPDDGPGSMYIAVSDLLTISKRSNDLGTDNSKHPYINKRQYAERLKVLNR